MAEIQRLAADRFTQEMKQPFILFAWESSEDNSELPDQTGNEAPLVALVNLREFKRLGLDSPLKFREIVTFAAVGLYKKNREHIVAHLAPFGEHDRITMWLADSHDMENGSGANRRFLKRVDEKYFRLDEPLLSVTREWNRKKAAKTPEDYLSNKLAMLTFIKAFNRIAQGEVLSVHAFID